MILVMANRPTSLAWLLGGAALSCASPPLAAPQEARPVAAPSAATREPVATSAEITGDAERLAFVSSICPAATKRRQGKRWIGCRACPPFQGATGAPDGNVVDDPPDFWALERLYRGSFSRPKADEVAAVFEGCESHAQNSGGTLLAEMRGDGYRSALYASGVHPRACQPYRRPDGRDLLVCQSDYGNQGVVGTVVAVFDFSLATAEEPDKGWASLVDVNDDSGAVCFGVDADRGVTQGSVVGLRLADVSGDAVPDLVVEVAHKKTRYTPALAQTLEKACNQPSGVGDVEKILGRPATDALVFVFDGKGFAPTPATASFMKNL